MADIKLNTTYETVYSSDLIQDMKALSITSPRLRRRGPHSLKGNLIDKSFGQRIDGFHESCFPEKKSFGLPHVNATKYFVQDDRILELCVRNSTLHNNALKLSTSTAC